MRMPLVLMMLSAFAIAGCQPGEEAGDAEDEAARAAFEKMELQWRADRERRLLAPDGWTSLVGLHWIDDGPHFVGSSGSSGIRLAMGPPELGLLRRDGDEVSLERTGEGVTVDGEPVAGTVVLRDDMSPDGPSLIGFDDGEGVAMVIRRHGRLGLRVKHAQAPARTGFTGLDYWPVDRGWVVEARFVPNPPGTTIEIADITGGVAPVANPGALEFTRDGKTHRIEALDEGGDELFLVFADRTNGHGSYPAGRFLYVPRPDEAGYVLVDFNRSYSPPCAFTAFATCPLPPPGNRLDLEIDAGEKAYDKPDKA